MQNSMEYWWKDTHRTKLKYSVETLSQCHFLHHKSHVDLSEVATKPLAWPERPEVDLGQVRSPHVSHTHIGNETSLKPSPTNCLVSEVRDFRASDGQITFTDSCSNFRWSNYLHRQLQ
jgi:hypothetical protein